MDEIDEMNIKFSLESPQQKDEKILISIENNLRGKFLYKFFIGVNGIWTTLKNFDEKKSIEWVPKEDGKYTIMIQAKREDSDNMFDYICRRDFIIGKVEEKLINNIFFNKEELKVGEKIELKVASSKTPLMYRYWIREDYSWSIIKDYSPDNNLSLTVRKTGEHEILVECKEVCSNNNYDDFKRIQFKVLPIENLEIYDFKCLCEKLLVGEELVFQVEVNADKDRIILYKFIKIMEDGSTKCIQDYSTKRMVSYVENNSGKYKLLCYVKDMYSTKMFDDRAVLNFEINKYEEVKIKSFTTDKVSPQICDNEILLKAVVTGGKKLLYRYIIKGRSIQDSGYLSEDSYTWTPKKAGNYNLTLFTKDESCEEKYEDSTEMEFVIDEKSKQPVNIKEIIVDKDTKVLVNEAVNLEVIATGGIDLKYEFIIRVNKQELNIVKYSSNNKQTFCFDKPGNYEIEVRVKDKFSNTQYDSHEIIYIEVCGYFPSKIDYLLHPLKQYFVCGDNVCVQAIVTNTTKTLMKYILKIDEHKVEETEYISNFKYVFIPKCKGVYCLEVYSKNINSDKLFDSKKQVKFHVNETEPITNTKIKSSKVNINLNDSVMFNVDCMGGKDNIYEFFIMEKNEWTQVQNYSKKNYYSFIPFSKGVYKILVLCKSSYKKCAYEDYDIFEFEVK